MRNTKRVQIPVRVMTGLTGVFTETLSSNVPIFTKTVGANTSTITMPVILGAPYIDATTPIGVIPKKVIVPYSVGVVSLTSAPAISLYKVSRTTAGVVSATEIASTISGNLAAVGDNVATVSVTDEALVNSEDSLHAVMTVVAPATATFVLKPAAFEFIENDHSVA